jgi:tetratricopeptide (TPR) repeat protein
VAFNNRGYAYSDKGDNDRAIADYSEAIRLDPKSATAFKNRGIAYLEKGDNDRAIADYSAAIRIDPEDANAFNSRGVAYRAKGDPARAIADYNEAIRLDPKSAMAFDNRGNAYHAKGDNERAIADYNEAIRLNPKSSFGYFARGRSYLFAGSVEKSLADFNQANAYAPKNAYVALWVDIVSQRNNLPSRLAQTSSQIDMTVWPAPVIRLFMNQMTPAAVLVAADDPNATKKKGQVCEANFYRGEFSLTKGLKDEATRLFRLAASDCPHSFNEWDTANAELKALGVVP